MWTWDLTNTGYLLRLSEDGQVLGYLPPMTESWDQVAFNSTDGSLTYVNGKSAVALHLARDGTEQQISLSYSPSPLTASRATVSR